MVEGMTGELPAISMQSLATISVLTCLLLTACGAEEGKPLDPETGQGEVIQQKSREGEFCGGIAAFQCDEGLTCQYEGTYPDAGGVCVKD